MKKQELIASIIVKKTKILFLALGGFLLIFIVLTSVYFYSYELKKISSDEYNLGELEEIKKVMSSIKKDDVHFSNIEDFNKLFNTEIIPNKNCYFLNSKNGKFPYIFAFQLESNKYKKQYGADVFVFPGYDLGRAEVCTGTCYDIIKSHFENIMSYPCDSDKSKYSKDFFDSKK